MRKTPKQPRLITKYATPTQFYIRQTQQRGRGCQEDVNLTDEDWVEDAVVLCKKSNLANYLQRLDDIGFCSRTLFTQ